MKIVAIIIVTIVYTLLVVTCQNKQTDSKIKQEKAAVVEDSIAVADSLLWSKADSLATILKLEEKAAMVLLPAIYTRSDAATLAQLTYYAQKKHVGGIILLKGDTLSARIISDTLRHLRRKDMFVAIDAEWGLGMRFIDAKTYPDAETLGENASQQAMMQYGKDVAVQCRRLGINMLLGPVVDVVPDSIADSSYIGKRSFGADAKKVADLTSAYCRGVENERVMTVVKHFPGHGGLVADSHKKLPVLYKSLHQLHEEDLLPFRRYISEIGTAIMVGHIYVPAIEPTMKSAVVSSSVIVELLRGDMKFKGLVLTDAMNMRGAAGARPSEAIAAGADIVLAPERVDEAINDIVAAVKSGDLKDDELKDRVRRIYYYMLRFQLI